MCNIQRQSPLNHSEEKSAFAVIVTTKEHAMSVVYDYNNDNSLSLGH